MKECGVCKRVFGDHVDRCDRDHSPLKTTMPIFPIINSYRLDERIGTGSLGIVYRGAKIGETTPLAIKIISPEIAQADPKIASIFLEEAQAMMNSHHDNIVKIIDFGQTNNHVLYLVMEYLEGLPLNLLIDQEVELPLETIYSLMRQICEAVSVMHKQDKLHHDLKASTIFVNYDLEGNEKVKVLDFGLARIKNQELCNFLPGARTQNIFGLPFYISPEQCDGLEIDKVSEVYSLGVIFYQLLVGRVPFVATSHRELMYKHINELPLPPRAIRKNIPEPIESIVLKALSKNPEDRLPSVMSIARLINMATTGKSGAVAVIPKMIPVKTETVPKLEMPEENYPPMQTSEGKVEQPPIYNFPSMPRAPQSNLAAPKIKSFFESDEKFLSLPKAESWKFNAYSKVLVEALRISKILSDSELNSEKIISQLHSELETKSVSKEDELFAPTLIKIYVPYTTTEKFQEIESIFNSIAFISNIYKFVREAGYRFFTNIQLEIEIVHPEAQDCQGCSLEMSWPTTQNTSNGLERIFQIESHQLVKSQLPAIQIPSLALLQPINASTYANHHLIVQPVTYLGRFRNVVDLETRKLIRRNDFPFLQPNNPSSPNTTISRQHAKIEFSNGNFFVYDTGSTNGTKVNRRENNSRTQIPVPVKGQGILLKHADIIQLGTALLSFEIISSENIDTIDKLIADLETSVSQFGSNAQAYRTMAATTSSTDKVVW